MQGSPGKSTDQRQVSREGPIRSLIRLRAVSDRQGLSGLSKEIDVQKQQYVISRLCCNRAFWSGLTPLYNRGP